MSAGSRISFNDPPSFLRAWAELAGLWSLAIAWPIYQRIAAGPEALTGIGIRRLDLVVFIAILSLLVPLAFTLPERLARLFSERAAALVHAVMIGLLGSLIVWSAFEPGLLSKLLAGLALLVVVALRLRTGFGRSFAGILAVATPVTIVLFLASYPISATFLPGEDGAEAGQTDVDTPVVLVVLDEFPLASLMNSQGHIDGRLFPNFARLERDATWYRQATSRSDHTSAALPSILTGEDPKAEPAFGEPTPPGYPGYPDSLCSIAERAGYSSWSIQFETDLCGRSASMPERLSQLLRAALPNHVSDSVNQILGGAANTERLSPKRVFERTVEKVTEPFGPFYTTLGEDRDQVFKDFIDEMRVRPGTVNLIHSALPHAEYQYLQDGTTYASRGLFDTDTTEGIISPSNVEESSKNLQQLTAQAMYVDKLVGRLIARLKREDVWDETLFALVADHGASFLPGTDRRHLAVRNAGWLLPVPLFIKYPGQEQGRISDVAADIRNVTPTLLDVLGLEPSPRATGTSLLEGAPPRTPVIHAVDADGNVVDLPRRLVERQRRQAIAFRNRALGSGLYALGGHPGLIGRPAATLGRPAIPYEPLDGTSFLPGVLILGGVPAYFQAHLKGVNRDPGPLAIAMDGRIAATARAWPRDGGWMTALNLPFNGDSSRVPKVTIFPIDPAR